MKAFATAIGRKGLLFGLILAGMGIQGCNTDDTSVNPVGTESPAVKEVVEDETGADLGTNVPRALPLRKPAASCVILTSRVSGIWRYARATNRCETPQRFRFIWAFAVDGECVTVPSNHYIEEGRGRQAYVTELRGC